MSEEPKKDYEKPQQEGTEKKDAEGQHWSCGKGATWVSCGRNNWS